MCDYTSVLNEKFQNNSTYKSGYIIYISAYLLHLWTENKETKQLIYKYSINICLYYSRLYVDSIEQWFSCAASCIVHIIVCKQHTWKDNSIVNTVFIEWCFHWTYSSHKVMLIKIRFGITVYMWKSFLSMQNDCNNLMSVIKLWCFHWIICFFIQYQCSLKGGLHNIMCFRYSHV